MMTRSRYSTKLPKDHGGDGKAGSRPAVMTPAAGAGSRAPVVPPPMSTPTPGGPPPKAGSGGGGGGGSAADGGSAASPTEPREAAEVEAVRQAFPSCAVHFD
jgi:hypothetical protein